MGKKKRELTVNETDAPRKLGDISPKANSLWRLLVAWLAKPLVTGQLPPAPHHPARRGGFIVGEGDDNGYVSRSQVEREVAFDCKNPRPQGGLNSISLIATEAPSHSEPTMTFREARSVASQK